MNKRCEFLADACDPYTEEPEAVKFQATSPSADEVVIGKADTGFPAFTVALSSVTSARPVSRQELFTRGCYASDDAHTAALSNPRASMRFSVDWRTRFALMLERYIDEVSAFLTAFAREDASQLKPFAKLCCTLAVQ